VDRPAASSDDLNVPVNVAIRYMLARCTRPTAVAGLVRREVCAEHSLVAYVRPGAEPAACIACSRSAAKSAAVRKRSRSTKFLPSRRADKKPRGSAA
jgi:hypothetical protein